MNNGMIMLYLVEMVTRNCIGTLSKTDFYVKVKKVDYIQTVLKLCHVHVGFY